MGFLSSLTGSSQKADARYGMRTANKYLLGGRDDALRETDEGLEKSLGFLNPYIAGGNQARELYENAVGVNGQPAQQGYFDTFQNDPGFQAEVDYSLGQVQDSAAGRGSLYSGRTLAALGDRAQMHQRSAFNERLDRLGGLSQLGQQASGQAAGLTTNAFTRRGDLQYGAAQQRANNIQNYASAAAQSKSAGVGNIIGLAGLATKALGAF